MLECFLSFNIWIDIWAYQIVINFYLKLKTLKNFKKLGKYGYVLIAVTFCRTCCRDLHWRQLL